VLKLRYFAVDASGQAHKVSRTTIEGLWDGMYPASQLGSSARHELRLVSVLCDKDLLPKKVFLLRLPLSDGWFREENLLTLRIFSRPDCVTPREVVDHHTAGWPCNLFRQLAVALDVPVSSLDVPLGIGGPLFMAAKLRVTPQEAVRYLR
jgi:hypothetical protein